MSSVHSCRPRPARITNSTPSLIMKLEAAAAGQMLLPVLPRRGAKDTGERDSLQRLTAMGSRGGHHVAFFRFSSDCVFDLLSLLPKVRRPLPYAWCAGWGVYRRPDCGVHEVGGGIAQIQRVVFTLLRIFRNSFGPLRSLRLRSCRSSSIADGSPRRSISWPANSDAFAALLVRAPVR